MGIPVESIGLLASLSNKQRDGLSGAEVLKETFGKTLRGINHGVDHRNSRPCEPTGKKTTSDYVYVMQFTGDKISHMTKIWHSGMALKELGWV